MEPDIFIITKLLSDPSRMHILDILMDGKAHTVNEIASFTKIKQHIVSYHLKLLTEAQVTTLQTYGRFHYYSLKVLPLQKCWNFSASTLLSVMSKVINNTFTKRN